VKTETVFSTPEKVKILGYILSEPGKALPGVRAMAKELGVTPGFVSHSLKLLREQDVVEKDNTLALSNPRVRMLKTYFNVNSLLEENVTRSILKHVPEATGIGVYGSWSNGTNHERSDLDLWARVKKRPEAVRVAKAQREISERLKVNVQLTALSDEQVKGLRSRGDPFYYSLYGSFVLWGEAIA
jgi:predicted nucleotidyltransferase